MEVRKTVSPQPPVLNTGMDHSEEMLAEVDEPPDELISRWSWSPLHASSTFSKLPPQSGRRESLLTRQLHSETEHTDEEHLPPTRALSTQSTLSNPSTTSTAELTSDDGHSVASPAVSPPLAATLVNHTLPLKDQPLDSQVKIVGRDHELVGSPAKTNPEKTLEANLGRKRCISFACRGKEEAKPVQPAPPATEKAQPASPPKRKCMLKFVCPSRAAEDSKAAEKPQAPTKRHASPPPPVRRSSGTAKADSTRAHRESDSTVATVSPQSTRPKPVAASPSLITPGPTVSVRSTLKQQYSDASDVDSGNEATRFHEFATSEDEPEGWVQESTVHRNRLTVSDTLKKENVIRKACEEVEEEAVEEEDEAEAEELEEEMEEVAGMDEARDDIVDDDEDDESDEGFHSDDEDGFANSDSEGDDSDYEWWRPGGASTAATSVDALDRLAIVNSQPAVVASSIGSGSSGHLSSRTMRRKLHNRRTASHATGALPIHRPVSPTLPDSTDFVCGTLDEDRPVEQAYINRLKMKQAAKHKARPQDIDPSFPTSDPEMDEEDDDDVDEVPESEQDHFMHGDLEELDGDESLARTPVVRRARTNSTRSPPPGRHHSPPPPSKRRPQARGSPAPPLRRRSPAPPRKLFSTSPRRDRAPAAAPNPMTSPPNTPTGRIQPSFLLAERPRLVHTASLPRGGSTLLLSRMGKHDNDEDDDSSRPTTDGTESGIPRRGAIDIVKGLERKRQRRKERLYAKACAKAAAKADRGKDKAKIKPGKGCERMREVGLGLQGYHGKAEHILSL